MYIKIPRLWRGYFGNNLNSRGIIFYRIIGMPFYWLVIFRILQVVTGIKKKKLTDIGFCVFSRLGNGPFLRIWIPDSYRDD